MYQNDPILFIIIALITFYTGKWISILEWEKKSDICKK